MRGFFARALRTVTMLPDDLDQLPPREILFTVMLTLVIRVEVCVMGLKMLAIILLTKLEATTFLSNLYMTRYYILGNTRWTCFSQKYN